MIRSKSTFLLSLLLLTPCASAVAQDTVHHELAVRLEPGDGHIAVEDRIRLPRPLAVDERAVNVTLNAAMEPLTVDPPARIVAKDKWTQGPPSVTRYTVSLPKGASRLTLRYQGRAGQRPVSSEASGPAEDPFSGGTIGPRGVYLSAASHWFPRIHGGLVSFSLEIDLPAGWTAVSQGKRAFIEDRGERSVVRWVAHQPQDDVIVAANRFHIHERRTPHADAYAYLLQPDQVLADRYLEATARYLDLYSRLIGPYPYAKFALVENFRETGYGMPSFTLLGSKVIRLPFILYTSYPHEVLHNWWGNGVYVDYASGNWSEGLTAYLAEHLIQEQRGRGVEHRRSALQKYRNYVGHDQDFALEAFRSKRGEASEAVGYNKALMFFHMLRRQLGDGAFVDGLRKFYAENRFRIASYADLRSAFEAISGLDLQANFDQWVTRVGAPALRIRDTRIEDTDSGYRLRAWLEQTQGGPAYRLQVPVAVELEGRDQAFRRNFAMDQKTLELSLTFDTRPLRFAVDPEFDLFRRLDADEIPPALGELFGSDEALFVLPAAAPHSLRAGYRDLAARLGAREVVTDADEKPLPRDRPVWVLGWKNQYRAEVAQRVSTAGVIFDPHGVRIHGEYHPRDGECVVLVARRAGGNSAALGWIGCENPGAIPGLARKLPHYGKYGYLGFAGSEPTNVLKGQWPVSESPLTVTLDSATNHQPMHLEPRPSLMSVVGK